MCGLVTKVPADRLGKPPQFDSLRLLGCAEEHGPLALREVGEQERLANPPAAPHDEEMGNPFGGELPRVIEPAELLGPIHERCEHTGPYPIIPLLATLRSCNDS